MSQQKIIRGTKVAAAPRRNRVAWGLGAAIMAGAAAFAVLRSLPLRPIAASSADQKNAAAAAASPFAPTISNKTPAPASAPEGMMWIPGGEFSMGSDAANDSLCGLPGLTRDALPIHRVYVDSFWMDATEVTNEQFEKFVKA